MLESSVLGKYFDVRLTVGAGCPIVISRPLRVPPRYPEANAVGVSSPFDRAGGRWKYLWSMSSKRNQCIKTSVRTIALPDFARRSRA